jgi:hypothetical protein
VFTSVNTTTTDTWTSEVLDFTATGSSTLISLVGASGQSYIGLDKCRRRSDRYQRDPTADDLVDDARRFTRVRLLCLSRLEQEP